jgi:geranylgeranyl pyrophosphate synthase
MMAAADLFDDAADADPGTAYRPGVLLTVGAGLLSLAGAALTRVVDDGSTAETAAALARLLGESFADATNGQARNLQTHHDQTDALTAYHEAAAKSGPLGALLARLGARTATADEDIVNLLGEFGRRLAVRSQLLNDASDAAPDAQSVKADVRSGARTVPLAFTRSRGAPPGLADADLAIWEQQERTRIAAAGGLSAARALAEAERLHAVETLDRLDARGCDTRRMRELV